ncbi:MAG: hypothetical protein AAF399_01625, partial [Bacteroidota bacterium]
MKFSSHLWLIGLMNLALWLIVPPQSTVAQASVIAQMEQHLAQFELNAAESLLPQLTEPGQRAFYEANIQTYEFLRTMDKEVLRRFREDWEQWEDQLDNLSETDQQKYVMMAELHSKRAIMEFLDQNYLTSVRYARTARVHIKRNQRRFPDNVEQLKILGVFNIAFGAVPSKYQWITNALGFRGDLQVGVEQLTKAADEGKLLPLETELLLCMVRKNILDQADLARERIETQQRIRGGNMLLEYLLATLYLDVKQNEQALAILENDDRYRSGEVSYLLFWDYQLGKAHYFKDDLREAQRYFARFLRDYKGEFMRTDANFRLGMALTLNGSYGLGKEFFSNVANAEDSDWEEDAYARHMAQKFQHEAPSEVWQQLFRARNYFDGGYYDRAIAALDALNKLPGALTEGDRAESAYRYGRIYHSRG